MSSRLLIELLIPLENYANKLRDTYGSRLGGQPEDQLKAPVAELLESFASTMGFSGVLTESEARVSGVGRPDVAVGVGGMIRGHVELKAPGRGADPERFDGHDSDQWEKFKALPNLIYTDANDWALFRGGERVATVRLAGDVTADGAAAIGSEDADKLSQGRQVGGRTT